MVCAAMFAEETGDTYIYDDIHYHLSVDLGILVSEPIELHERDGLWWWYMNVPPGRKPDPFYAKVREAKGFIG